MSRVVRLATVLLLLGGVFAIAACSPSRLSEAVDVLADIGAGTGPSDLKRTTPSPVKTAVSYTVGGRARHGDRYRAGATAVADMVLVPGAARRGKDDPRLIAFARTFARARFDVLVPDVPRMRSLELSSDDARILADAVIHMARRDAAGPDGARPLGMAAISFAVGPSVLALYEPEIDGRVDFVVSVGGYYDLEAVITFFTTGFYRETPSEPWRYREPNAYGKWVFVLSNAARLQAPGDRAALERMARAKLADLDADVSTDAAALGEEGRAVYALLTNDDPDRVAALLAALPQSIGEEIAALDLKNRDLKQLNTRFVLIHGRNDPIIPATESVKLAAAIGPDQADLHLVDNLSHVDPEPPRLGDTLTLLQAIYEVLSLRDHAASRAP